MPKCKKAGQENTRTPRERVRGLIPGVRILRRIQALAMGIRLQDLLRLFEQRKPKHLRVAVLLDKPERRIAAVRADYVGFSIPNEFVVGYGLDYAERYRNLPYVGVLLLGRGLKEKPAEH